MVRRDAAPRSAFGPHHQRHGRLATEHVAVLGALVGQLVHRERREVDVHDLSHGLHAGHRGADAGAGDGRLADGRVAHSLGAEVVVQPARDGVRAAVEADVLAHDEDALVALHLLAQGLVECLTSR